MRFVCSICGYIYDEARESIPFSSLPPSWRCPLCKASKSAFAPEKKEAAKSPATPVTDLEDSKELSAGVLAALCTSLARGCEKQYKEEEAGLFRQLGEYFTAAMSENSETGLDGLAELIQQDREKGYPAVKASAEAQNDRGTQRVCVWGEKVTNMLNYLTEAYLESGETFLEDTRLWVCSVCGFIYMGDTPPALCPVCKVPDWKFEEVKGRDSV